MLYTRSRPQQLLVAGIFFISCILLFRLQHGPLSYRDLVTLKASSSRCPELVGADDVLFILKTGGTESHALIPAHLRTYLSCIPHYTIYSDIAEQIDGHQVHDTFESIDEDIRLHEPDFELYRHQLELQREGQPLDILRDAPEIQKEDKKAWKLDKWKFLPLVDKAIETHPNATWYFFYEADTYFSLVNLFGYLSTLDPQQPWYIGAQNNFGSTEFAHGGAGYILSSSAAHMVSKQVRDDKERYLALVRKECCGDLILSLVFEDLGIPVTRAWPLLQGETPVSLDYQTRNWCRPAISYHHMTPEAIAEYWSFERSWRSQSGEPIMHRDAFEHFVEPNLQQVRVSWDNRSGDRVFTKADASAEGSEVNKAAHMSFAACEAACSSDDQCVQLAYAEDECRLGYRPTLGGNSTSGFECAWLTPRIAEFKAKQEPCSPHWTPS